MITLGKTYSSNMNASEQAKPVVLYRSSEIDNARVNRFVASALMVVSVSVLSLQTGFVLNANAMGNPVTSPITAQTVTCPVGKVSKVVDSTIICVSQDQTQSQSNNNQNQNVVATGGSSSSSTNNVITAPEVSPSPVGAVINVTVNPITAPEVSPSPSSQPDGGNGGGGSSNSGGSSSSSCNNEAPKAPYIVSAITTGKNEITLNWTKPQGNVTHYSISYGVQKGKPMYGAANVGNATSFRVKGLSGGTTYYFTIKAVNDCTPSAASNEVAMKVGGKFISSPAQGFKPGVLGKNNTNPHAVKNSGKPGFAKPVVFNNEAIQAVNTGLAGKIANFFKGFFN